jgi:hypothetical protein
LLPEPKPANMQVFLCEISTSSAKDAIMQEFSLIIQNLNFNRRKDVQMQEILFQLELYEKLM